MKTLVEICEQYNLKHNADGWKPGDPIFDSTDKESWHKYCSGFYDKEFPKYRNLPINLLEIGVQKGGSMLLWNHYFTNAKIYGVDIIDYGSIEKTKGLSNVEVMVADAYNDSFAKMLPNFDIIIDDGPHTYDSQVSAIKLYLPKLNDGGIMVIEDFLNDSWVEDYKKLVPQGCSYEVIDTRVISGIPESLLFVIRKD